MHVSLHFTPQSRGPSEDHALIEDIVERTVLAERAGIASISLTEHHLGGFNTYSDPFMLGAHLAPRLGDMYLVTMVVQVPLDHPLRIAERANVLDQLTKGRCMIGLGSGSPRKIELDAFAIDPDRRADITRQRIEALAKAWSWDDDSSPVDLATDYDRGTIGARVTPASYRQPHPLVGCVTSTDAVVLDCARRGWPAILVLTPDASPRELEQARLYRDALVAAGHPNDVVEECSRWLGPLTSISLGATEREARDRQERYVEAGGRDLVVTDANAGTPEWVAEWRKRHDERVGRTYCGTPEMIAEYLQRGCDAHDANHARTMLLDVPGESQENFEQHQMFLEEVMPMLDPEPLPGPARTLEALGEPGGV